ncbi:hypothetical protein C8A01DRAFT_49125 [Parachaetomium inaequale]|uniref:Uncharacterized protein n=1 Tax=Parachaetomium inaequale TaxID=2588326 RepID=A0AAN6P9Z7_9PEZI|nr:hypothetical protein C8A01DRAFT_49125 [Parachaetomium inaequale]
MSTECKANRIKKVKPKVTSILRANYLLAAILSANELLTIRPCSAYEVRGLDSYEVSKTDSSRYTEYVRFKRSNYNVLNELLEAEERFEKIIRAISYSINTIEELERVEREEAEALAASEASTNPTPTSATPPLLGNDFVLS